MKKLFPMLFLSLILVMPFASAQFYYSYFNPSDLLDNQWFIFTAFFAVFFGVIYTSLGRVLGGTTPTLIIAAAIAFVVSAGMQRDWYILQQPIMLWATVLLAAFMILTFLKFFFRGEGKKGIWILLFSLLLFWGLWPFFKNTLPIESIEFIPYGLIDFLDATAPLILIIAIGGSIVWAFWGSKKYARWQAERRPESYKKNL